MADGPAGAREIYIDLTVTGARTIRSATGIGQAVKIMAVRINGTAPAGTGDIVLRADSATGNIIFKELASGSAPFDGTMTPVDIYATGLYMDALASAWAAGSFMLIYTI